MKIKTAAYASSVVVLLTNITIVGLAVYVAWHFISKFW